MTDASMDPGTQSEHTLTEAARQEALARLSEGAIGAGLTLGEYAERAGAIERAATNAELDATVVGLAQGEVKADAHDHARWLVGIFGGSEQRGRWRLGNRLRIVALMGGVKLDLGNAQPEASESLITVLALLGGVDLIAPPGLPIELSGISLLGGKSDKRPSGPPLAGAPVIRVRAFAVLGGVGIKQPKSPRGRLTDRIRKGRAEPSNSAGQSPPDG